jgi:hypothetical protein
MKRVLLLATVVAACAHARTADEYRADTAKLMATKNDEIKACYDKILAAQPKAAGVVTVDFAVEAKTGHLADVRVNKAQTTAPDDVSQCVLAAIPSLAVTPGDRKRGQGTWAWQFNAKE